MENPPKIMLGDKTSLPLDPFHLTWLRQLLNLFMRSWAENEISSMISIQTCSQTFIISSEIFFDFEFKNATLCKVTPPNNAAAHPVIAVKRNFFHPI
jgi:hypothetical protein